MFVGVEIASRLAPLVAAYVDVKTVTVGEVFIHVLFAGGHQVPLTYGSRAVARVAERFGKGAVARFELHGPVGHAELGEGTLVAANPVGHVSAGRVLAGHQGGACRGADRAGRVAGAKVEAVRS